MLSATVQAFQEEANVGGDPTPQAQALQTYITRQLQEMQRFRTHIGVVDRLNTCLRLREGQYDAAQLQAILNFGGSSVFARLATNKIRGAAAMLRSIFVQGDRPWEIRPTPIPSLPEEIGADIQTLVGSEARTMAEAGQPPDAGMLQQRMSQLQQAALDVARKQAKTDAHQATLYVDDILTEGDFYEELDNFILDFCTYPFAVLAGPTAVMETGVDYVNGKPTRVRKAKLKFRRVDPYYIMWSPGASSFENADILERMPMNRAQLTALIGLEGYDEKAIRSVIRDYGQQGFSYREFYEQVHEDATGQNSQFYNTLIDVLAFTGKVSGDQLQEFGIRTTDENEIIHKDMEYQVQAWMCGQYILKAQVDPDPVNRPSYYSASYEPVPGSIVGTALLELIADVLEVYNAVLRALVNNVAFASGPMVGVNTSRWQAPADGRVRIEPWMIWRYDTDPTAPSGEKPVEFWQPQLNAQELMAVLSFLQNMADEISGIPRYLTGSDKIGGAGRTSSGLSMLMGNATRTMTSVAGGIDRYVLEPLLRKTYDLILLTTGTDVLRGDEEIAPRGATYAEQREQDRARMVEFLNSTMNPVDLQIMGIPGRGAILRKVSESFMGDDEVVPDMQALQQMQQQQQLQQMQQAAGGGQPGQELPGSNSAGGGPQGAQPSQSQGNGGTPPKPGPGERPGSATDNAFRARSPGTIQRQTRRAA
jgi:hypothetical protein